MKRPHIAVFDFNPQDGEQTADSIRAYYRWIDHKPEISMYTEHVAFSASCMEMCRAGDHFDMIFIGVDTMKGADVARSIRAIDDACPLFLVSGATEFAVEGFRLRALDYLTKPLSRERVAEAIERISREREKNGDKS